MNKEELRLIALESGIVACAAEPSCSPQYLSWGALQNFALLIQAREREKCAKAVEALNAYDEDDPLGSCAEAIRSRGHL